MKPERRCRVCGCTEFRACIDRDTAQPCHWIADDLCSACSDHATLRESQVYMLATASAAVGAAR